MCFSFQSAFVCCVCCFVHQWDAESFLCPCELHSWQRCVLNGHFLAKCQLAQFQQVNGGFFYVELGDVVHLSGIDCGCCSKY